MPDSVLWLFAFAWFLAGFVNGISGMGAAMVALPIVAGCMPARMLVPATCIMVLVISAGMALIYRKDCRWESLGALFLGALPGSLAGLAVLLVLSTSILQLCAGCLMMAFVLWQFRHGSMTAHGDSLLTGTTAGFASGFINTSISFGNPPVAIYALYAGWGQRDTMGTMNIFTLGATIITCAAHASAGLYSADVLRCALWGTPAVILGMLLATPLVRYIRGDLFRKILLGIIAAAGFVCIARGIREIF